MNIAEILSQQATARPTAPAIIDTVRGRRRVTTFAALETASVAIAGQLRQAGLRPGDAVLVFQPMSAELYIILAALFRLGLVAMFLDPGQGRAHIDRCCRLHPPQALIAAPKAHLLRLLSPAVHRIPRKFFIRTGGRLAVADWRWALSPFLARPQSSASARPRPQPLIHQATVDTPALLTFTSGSTGQPKAALRSHGFLLAQHQALADSLQLAAGQVDLATMPVVLLANLASGVTSLIPQADLRRPGQIDPDPAVAQIRAEGVQSIVASPALLARLASYGRANGVSLPGLQKIFTGGAPVFPPLLNQLQQLAPQARVVAVYGSTEAEPMAKITHHQITAADTQRMRTGGGLLVGPPVAAIRLKIVPDCWGRPLAPCSEAEFAARCLPANQVGEIVVSGPHVLPGYLHGRGDKETKFWVGETLWHRTGDAGYLDEQGRLWLLGRCAAKIEDKQDPLYPFAVECAVSFWPGVSRSALVAHRGQRLLALELSETAPPPDLSALHASLGWASLDDLRLLKQIPVDKRHNAKVDYPALFQLLSTK